MNVVPQMKAGGNISPCRFVSISGDFTVIQSTAGSNSRGDAVLGVSQQGTRDAPISGASAYAGIDGDAMQIHGDGDICLLTAATTTTAGDLLKSDANGKGTPIASSGVYNDNIGAVALQGGSADELILVQICTFRHYRPALT